MDHYARDLEKATQLEARLRFSHPSGYASCSGPDVNFISSHSSGVSLARVSSELTKLRHFTSIKCHLNVARDSRNI
jgi:hypothetical protein